MRAISATLSAALALLFCGLAHAQTEPAPAVAVEGAAPATPAPTTRQIPAATEIVVEVVTPLSSRTSQVGQTFELRLVDAVMVDGQVAIPAGTTGAGEVIDAAPAGLGGRPGKLVVSGRYLDLNGQRIRIRGMTLNLGGERMTNTSQAVSMLPYVGLVGPFIQGGNIEIPTGTRAQARIALATDVPVAPAQIQSEQQAASAPDSATEGQQQ